MTQDEAGSRHAPLATTVDDAFRFRSWLTHHDSLAVIDPEVRSFVEESERFCPPDAASLPLVERRRLYEDYARVFAVRRPETVVSRDATLAADGRAIPLRRYRPAGALQGIVLYAHGGGFMLGSLDSHDGIVARIAAETGAMVIAIDYRLAPEHPAPGGARGCGSRPGRGESRAVTLARSAPVSSRADG